MDFWGTQTSALKGRWWWRRGFGMITSTTVLHFAWAYSYHALSENVKPGFINHRKRLGCLIRGLPFQYHIISIWGYPLVNKLCFIDLGLTLHETYHLDPEWSMYEVLKNLQLYPMIFPLDQRKPPLDESCWGGAPELAMPPPSLEEDHSMCAWILGCPKTTRNAIRRDHYIHRRSISM